MENYLAALDEHINNDAQVEEKVLRASEIVNPIQVGL
jgi:hypothetical protein